MLFTPAPINKLTAAAQEARNRRIPYDAYAYIPVNGSLAESRQVYDAVERVNTYGVFTQFTTGNDNVVLTSDPVKVGFLSVELSYSAKHDQFMLFCGPSSLEVNEYDLKFSLVSCRLTLEQFVRQQVQMSLANS